LFLKKFRENTELFYVELAFHSEINESVTRIVSLPPLRGSPSPMRPKVPLQVLNSIKTSSNEGGFAIPIAIGMGLILIVMATTAIVRSQGDRVAST
jgi:hypothetical protein